MKAESRPWPSTFNDVREGDRDLLGSIPLETLLEWARERPGERFPALAGVVCFYDVNDASSSPTWSRVAEKIIANAPNPQRELEIFLKRLVPTSYSGSRAAVMTSRLPLIQALAAHGCREVSEWAKRSDKYLRVDDFSTKGMGGNSGEGRE